MLKAELEEIVKKQNKLIKEQKDHLTELRIFKAKFDGMDMNTPYIEVWKALHAK